MVNVIHATGPTGPTGATGPVGPLGSKGYKKNRIALRFSLSSYTKDGDEAIHVNTTFEPTDKGIIHTLDWLEHVLKQAKSNVDKFGPKSKRRRKKK